MASSTYAEYQPGHPLPTLAGLVHGIVGMDPAQVQCDGCHTVRTGLVPHSGGQIILTRIRFNSRLYPGDPRRLCDRCAETEWPGR